MSATELEVVDLTPEAFSPFGTVGVPLGDGAHGRGDVALDLSQGRPRFYIMRLEGRGLGFDRMARHNRVTQCLGTTDGLPWLIAVAPAGIAAPTIADIRAFRIPPDQFIALAHGTWHAGPYFSEARRDFYNLELIDTNKADFTSAIWLRRWRSRHHAPDPVHDMAPQTGEAANIIIPDDGVISPRAILGNIPLRLLSQRSDPRGALQLGAHFGCMSATGLLGPRATRHCRERPLPVLAAHPNAEGDPRQAEARAGSRAFAAAEGVRATAS